MDSETRRSYSTKWAVVFDCLVAGLLTFAVVTVVLTTVLDPLLWPSLLVSLPLGFAIGSAVAVVGYYYATRVPESRIDRRTINIGIVATFLVFGLLVGGLYALGQQRLDESYESTYEYQVTLSADHIDTADPFVDEPMLSRPYNRSEVECAFATGSRHRCYEYDGRVYANYDTANDTTVSLRISPAVTSGPPVDGPETSTESGSTSNCGAHRRAGISLKANSKSGAATIESELSPSKWHRKTEWEF
ncbi:hypothetical protein [Haloarcula amylovorans]|uniref:hypothetical protein n=1 Tax=Haloarcula amylovorans TaxID=2562280 RepID=UPI00107694BA|nr:hypothetical protein [Halomicroarcula amylolytica]